MNPRVFVLSGGVRHRPAKSKTGLEGTFVQKKKKKKQKKAAINKNIYAGLELGRQLKEAKAILGEEDVPVDCCSPCTQEMPQENFPGVVLLASLGVRKCHGCKGQILRQNSQPPKDLVFCMQAL